MGIVEGMATAVKKVRVAYVEPIIPKPISKKGPYMIVMTPSIQEMEGMYHVVKKGMSLQAAWDWRAKQKGKYFSDGCYIVVIDYPWSGGRFG